MLFKNDTTRIEFDKLDPRLQFILFAVEGYLGEFMVTDLFRPGDKGLHPHLKAADIVPAVKYEVRAWLVRLKTFCDKHLQGVDVVIALHGTALHAHLEIDPKQHTDFQVILSE